MFLKYSTYSKYLHFVTSHLWYYRSSLRLENGRVEVHAGWPNDKCIPSWIFSALQKFSGNTVMTISQFEGQLTDIHVWDKILPLSSLRAYMSGWDYPSGNLLSWRNMTYSSEGYVVLEDAYQTQDKSTENRRSGNQQQQQRRRHGRRGDGKCSHGRGRHHKRQRAVEAL